MSIREIPLDTGSFGPGENLSQKGGEYTHIVISYDISGERYKVDRYIEKSIESDYRLVKIECVNTTLYWQVIIGSSSDSEIELNEELKKILKEKIKKVFVNEDDLSYEIATIFCVAGNIRCFAFEVDV